MSGWWFGEIVGGDQVWARNPSKSFHPPKSGWRTPWDGEEIPGLLTVSPKKPVGEAEGSGTASTAVPATAVATTAEEVPVFQVKLANGWFDFSDEDQKQLQAAFKVNQPTVQFTRDKWKMLVDFGTMTQTNLKTKRVR